MWRIFSFPYMTIAGKSKISLHVEKFQMSSHDRCGKIWNSPHLTCVLYRKRRHICKIYAIFLKNQFCQNLRTLLRNPFGCNLRTFVWRKIYPKILYVEKKWQISGVGQTKEEFSANDTSRHVSESFQNRTTKWVTIDIHVLGVSAPYLVPIAQK